MDTTLDFDIPDGMTLNQLLDAVDLWTYQPTREGAATYTVGIIGSTLSGSLSLAAAHARLTMAQAILVLPRFTADEFAHLERLSADRAATNLGAVA